MKTVQRLGIAAACVAIAASCALVGCNRQAGASKQYKIAGIILKEDEFFKLVQTGMEQAAKEQGVDLQMNTSNTLDKEVELINTCTTSGVDAIVIAPQSKESSAKALQAAAAKGIKVVCANTPIDADFVVSDIESDAVDLGTETGKAAVKFINEKLGGKANIAIIAFDDQLPEQSKARTKGFVDEVSKLPGVKIVAHQDANMADKAQAQASAIVTAHPEVNIFWSANEGGTVGSVLAVKELHKEGKMFVFGTDASDQLIGFLESPDNILQAITSQKPVDVGRMSVEYAVKALKGEKVEKSVIMKGILLSRDDAAGVADFKKKLAAWKAGG
jgi:simple sugar transport system substrate-binding protein/ribose transport system substrate-binding protein